MASLTQGRIPAVLSFAMLCAAGIQLISIRGNVALVGYLCFLAGLFMFARWKGIAEQLADLWREERKTIRACFAVFLLIYPVLLTVMTEKFGVPLRGWIPHATTALIYIMLAQGLNLIVGFTGLLVLGYVAFWAIGAYTCAILTTSISGWWMLWLCFPIAAALGSLAGFGLGGPTLRLRGDYLAIVTLGFGEIVWIVVTNWDSMTNGPKGISEIPPPALGSFSFGDGFSFLGMRFLPAFMMYYLALLLCTLIVLSVGRLHNSRVGRAWIAIREDELAAEAIGVHTVWYKLLAFAVSAAIAAIAGVLYASRISYVDPSSFLFLRSAIILCMVVLGGMGSLSGATIGATMIVFLEVRLQAWAEWRMAVFGLALVILMILRPEGLLPPKRIERQLYKVKA